MHERIRLNTMYKIFQNYPWSTVNWNSASHERIHLIIWRVQSTDDKMIQVVEKCHLKKNKSWLSNDLFIFLQQNTVSIFTK